MMTTTDPRMELLLEAIRRHSGMGDEEIREAGEHGADAGWPGFTYTADAAGFYRENADIIDEMLADTADSMGVTVAGLIATFARADMADTRDGRDNLLAWYALEEAGHYLADRGDDDDEDPEA